MAREPRDPLQKRLFITIIVSVILLFAVGGFIAWLGR